MASIADILIAKGNAAAAGTLQRGNIYADLIRNLSSIPGQAMQQQRALEQDRLKQQIQQQQLQVGQQDLQLGGLKLDEAKRQQQDRDYLGSLLNDPSVIDPNTGRPNQAALLKRAQEAGHGHQLPQIADLTDHLNKSADDAEARNDANRKRDLEQLGVGAQKVAAGGYSPGDLHLLVTFYANPNRVGGALISPEQANSYLAETDPARVKQITQMLMTGTAAGKAESETENVPAGASVIRKAHPELGAVFTAPEKKEAPTPASLAATANDPKQPPPVRAAAQAALDALQTTPGQEETVRHNKAMEDIGRLTFGREAAAQQETARHNKAMEDATAKSKSARPVLSSDANRITDIDTGIKEADALNAAIAGRTGTGSWVGANLPDFVTNLTGLGTESKQRQAIIDRIRQMIGKTLEGGVLRKEDEIKYAKILPTIGDPPDVVATKIAGLRETLQRKRETTLESLDDAGFNVEAFKARGAPQAPATGTSTTTSGAAPSTTAPQFKVGDVVSVKGQQIRITAIHPDGTFDGNPVR
jgi:hypothetical protein